MHTSLQEILAVRGTADNNAAPRFDIYASIHKGVRLMLADLITSAGRVDPADAASVKQLAEKVEAAADFCVAHLAHEDAFVHPALERAQPGTSHRIASEHVEHERDIEALRAHARALPGRAPKDRPAACRALYHAVSLLSLRWMLPALAPAERLGLLGGMRNAPAPVFNAGLALARERLNDDDWAKLARGLGLPVAPGLTA